MDYARFKMLTFDVVGTLIDFEAGILGFFADLGCDAQGAEVLKVFAQAEGRQQIKTPDMPFTQMLEPIYEQMAPKLGLSSEHGPRFRTSIPHWPAFPDSIEALSRLRSRYRLVALTNADNWALSHMSKTLWAIHSTIRSPVRMLA